jgi:hypothetical protein
VRVVTIGAFILARVDEDAFLAGLMVERCAPRRGPGEGPAAWVGSGSWSPQRVLALCTARRLLVESHRVSGRDATPCPCASAGSAYPPCHTLRAVALEWADHPDYRPEWRAHPVPLQAARSA